LVKNDLYQEATKHLAEPINVEISSVLMKFRARGSSDSVGLDERDQGMSRFLDCYYVGDRKSVIAQKFLADVFETGNSARN
jgi:hypothetical protein